MITGNAAKIMGIDKRYGTLEAGKSATLIISTGDALDAPTQNIEYAWIDGVPVSMENWQEDLHNRWMQIVPAAPSK
jgi:imidazolonepropionase-like amidohydrolase